MATIAWCLILCSGQRHHARSCARAYECSPASCNVSYWARSRTMFAAIRVLGCFFPTIFRPMLLPIRATSMCLRLSSAEPACRDRCRTPAEPGGTVAINHDCRAIGNTAGNNIVWRVWIALEQHSLWRISIRWRKQRCAAYDSDKSHSTLNGRAPGTSSMGEPVDDERWGAGSGA